MPAITPRADLVKSFTGEIAGIKRVETQLTAAKTLNDLTNVYWDTMAHGAAERLTDNAVSFSAQLPAQEALGHQMVQDARNFESSVGVLYSSGDQIGNDIKADLRSDLGRMATDSRKAIELLNAAK